MSKGRTCDFRVEIVWNNDADPSLTQALTEQGRGPRLRWSGEQGIERKAMLNRSGPSFCGVWDPPRSLSCSTSTKRPRTHEMIAPSTTAPKSFRQTIGLAPSSVKASSGTTALIVIDAQGTYAPEGGLAISGVEEAQKEIAGAVAKYRQVSWERRRSWRGC